MSIGKMRHRLILERRSRISDGAGGVDSSWNEVASFWGSVTPKSGKEVFSGMQIDEEKDHEIRIRYREDISAADRINHNDRIFNIKSILTEDERRRYMLIVATEGAET